MRHENIIDIFRIHILDNVSKRNDKYVLNLNLGRKGGIK